MFIRFCSGEVDELSQVAVGLFCVAYDLERSDGLPAHDFDALTELKCWFDKNLCSPFDYLPQANRYDYAVCWFKPTAREHLARAWEMVAILERNDILIWTIKSPRTGYVYYEDEVQVFAQPNNEVRAFLESKRR